MAKQDKETSIENDLDPMAIEFDFDSNPLEELTQTINKLYGIFSKIFKLFIHWKTQKTF